MDVVVVAAGDCAFVFDEDDDRADLQELVCIGSNLDTERFEITAEKWEKIQPLLGSDYEVEIVDCRRGVRS